LVNNLRFFAFYEVGFVTTADIESLQVSVTGAALRCRTGDLVSIQMQNRKYSSVTHGVEKVDRFPASFEWARFGFTIADNAGNDEIGVIECCTECVNH
jgi:hypothetical protein